MQQKPVSVPSLCLCSLKVSRSAHCMDCMNFAVTLFGVTMALKVCSLQPSNKFLVTFFFNGYISVACLLLPSA